MLTRNDVSSWTRAANSWTSRSSSRSWKRAGVVDAKHGGAGARGRHDEIQPGEGAHGLQGEVAGGVLIARNCRRADRSTSAHPGTTTVQPAASIECAAAKPTDGRNRSTRQVTKSPTRGVCGAMLRGGPQGDSGVPQTGLFPQIGRGSAVVCSGKNCNAAGLGTPLRSAGEVCPQDWVCGVDVRVRDSISARAVVRLGGALRDCQSATASAFGWRFSRSCGSRFGRGSDM